MGPTVVMLALVLGAGGVARRPLAEPAAPEASGSEAAALAGVPIAEATDADAPELDASHAGTCRPEPPRSVTIDLSHVTPPEGFVSLNSRGYNYRRPGEPPQVIPTAATGARANDAAPSP
jgi:hypothetical protein